MGMERTARVVGHQDAHLPLGQVLDVLVERSRFACLDIDGATCFLITFESEESPPLHGQVAPSNAMFR